MNRHARALPRSERLPASLLGGIVATTTPSGERRLAELLRGGREQLLIPGVEPVFVPPPRVAIVPARTIDEAVRTAAAERDARAQLFIDFAAPPRPRVTGGAPALPVLQLPVAQGRGGPDPARPCEGCAKRARCRAPCELLSALLNPEELVASNEISSPALMQGRGYDEAFMSFPDVDGWREDDSADRWPVVVAEMGPQIRAHLGDLTRAQREVVGMFLDGKSRSEIGRARGTRRQVTHKIFHAALKTISEILGPLPDPRGGRRG